MGILNFFIDILQWGYYEHHARNRLKQDAHITPVEGGGNKPNGGPKNAKSLYYRPFSCWEPLWLALTHITSMISCDLWTYEQSKCNCVFF